MFQKTRLACAAFMSFTTGSLAAATTIVQLKTGDVLEGTEVLSGKSCKVEVTGSGLKTKTVKVTLGQDTVYKTTTLKKAPGSLWHYMGTYSSKPYVNSIDLQNCLENVEGSLTEGFMNDKIRYRIYYANWCEQYYRTHEPFVDCQQLTLR